MKEYRRVRNIIIIFICPLFQTDCLAMEVPEKKNVNDIEPGVSTVWVIAELHCEVSEIFCSNCSKDFVFRKISEKCVTCEQETEIDSEISRTSSCENSTESKIEGFCVRKLIDETFQSRKMRNSSGLNGRETPSYILQIKKSSILGHGESGMSGGGDEPLNRPFARKSGGCYVFETFKGLVTPYDKSSSWIAHNVKELTLVQGLGTMFFSISFLWLCWCEKPAELPSRLGVKFTAIKGRKSSKLIQRRTNKDQGLLFVPHRKRIRNNENSAQNSSVLLAEGGNIANNHTSTKSLADNEIPNKQDESFVEAFVNMWQVIWCHAFSLLNLQPHQDCIIMDQEISSSDADENMAKTDNFQVTAEEITINKKNKLFCDMNDEQPKKSNDPKDVTKDRFDSNHHPTQLHVEIISEEPEIVKLMQPPQDERSRQATFGEVGNYWYSAGDFSRGGFYLNYEDHNVTCFSCQAQHNIDEIVGSPPSDARWHLPACRHAWTFRSIRPRGQVNSTLYPTDEVYNRVQVTSGPRQVASDGAVSDNVGDPPGQRSTYIPPGDQRMEFYRLSTFEHFPITDPNSRKNFAKNGFYFTGFSDQVKCFACARSVVRWSNGDNPADQKWHKSSCPFMRGQASGNIPIRNLFGNLAARIAPSGPIVLQDVNNGSRFSQDMPERVGQAGSGVLIRQSNGNWRENDSVRTPEIPYGIRDPPPRSTPQISTTRNAVVNTPQPRAPVPTWRMANVASSDHKRFLTNLYLNRELDRLASFARWPTDRPNVPPSALAKTGFYYLGDMDRVQCFSCGGVLRNWTLDDSAEREHRVHFGGCNMVLGNEPLNIPIPSSPESPELLATNYPLRFPSNPHMRGQAQREATFDRRWPTGRINVSIEQIAEAGFFYLGERDRVKCFYCNGGLQNWEFDDIPWDEHAKWFPNCQFLLRSKGQKFVHRHLGPHAQLARPIIGRQDGSPLENIRRSPGSSQGYDIPPSTRRAPTPPPTIIDPQEEMRKRKERVQNILRNSETAKSVIGMGFSEQVVATVIEDRILATNDTSSNGVYGSVSELLDDVMKKEEEMRQEEEQRRNEMNSMLSNPSEYSMASSTMSSLGPSPGTGKYNVSYYGEDEDMSEIDMYSTNGDDETHEKQIAGASSASLQQQLNQIEEERMCKICFTNVADMLFSPCSHMVCCMECTQAIRDCPICRKKIEKALKTYVK